MSSNINLFNHNMGIQKILDRADVSHIPDAKPLASNIISEAGLTEHFGLYNVQTSLEASLTPDVEDGEALRPDVFNQNIRNCIKKLANHPDPAVQALLEDVLKPLAENKDLLNAYAGLMVGG